MDGPGRVNRVEPRSHSPLQEGAHIIKLWIRKHLVFDSETIGSGTKCSEKSRLPRPMLFADQNYEASSRRTATTCWSHVQPDLQEAVAPAAAPGSGPGLQTYA